MAMADIWWLPVTAAISGILTRGVYRYAIARQVLDYPNSRSAHTQLVPRGGGVAIAATFLGAVITVGAASLLALPVVVGLVGAGLVVMGVGFIDDHRQVPVASRLAVHFLSALWLLYWFGGLPPVALPAGSVDFGWFGFVIGAVGLVWLLNLYNFMDGVDGIAAIEAVTVCLAAAYLYSADPRLTGEWWLPVMLAMAALGFLPLNWPPARMFMGDAGSGFLGIMLGGLILRAASLVPNALWMWLILLGVFIVDTGVTLVFRLIRRERLHEAHFGHVYQLLARSWGAHRPVTLLVATINVLWLFPLAMLVQWAWLSGLVGLLIAYFPLIVLALRFSRRPLSSRSRFDHP